MNASSQPSLHERYVGLVAKPTYWGSLKLALSYISVLAMIAAVQQFRGPPPSDGTYFQLALALIGAYLVFCAILALPVWAWRYRQWRRDVIAELLATGRQGSPR